MSDPTQPTTAPNTSSNIYGTSKEIRTSSTILPPDSSSSSSPATTLSTTTTENATSPLFNTISPSYGTLTLNPPDTESQIPTSSPNNAPNVDSDRPISGVWVTVKHVLYVIVTPCLLSICSLCYVMYFLYSILNIEKYSPEMRLIMIGLLVVAVKQLYGQDLRGIAGNVQS